MPMNRPIDILFVDPLSDGHSSFNQLYAQSLSKTLQVAVAFCYGYRIALPAHLGLRRLVRTRLRTMGKVGYRFDCLVTTLHVAFLALIVRPRAIVFSSYETISLSCVSYLLPKRTYAIDHNNIDELNSAVKRFFFQRIRRRIVHIGFAPYICERTRSLGQRVIHIPFPIRHADPVNNERLRHSAPPLQAFAPSGQQDLESVKRFLEIIAGDPRIELLMKRQTGVDADSYTNVHSTDYYADYEQQLLSSDFIVVLSRFEYRVSGVAYEAIGANKPVFMARSRFATFLKEEFPRQVRMVDDCDSVEDLLRCLQELRPQMALNPNLGSYSVDAVSSVWGRLLNESSGR